LARLVVVFVFDGDMVKPTLDDDDDDGDDDDDDDDGAAIFGSTESKVALVRFAMLAPDSGGDSLVGLSPALLLNGCRTSRLLRKYSFEANKHSSK